MPVLRVSALTPRQKKIFASLLLACATFVVFGIALANDFVGWDDDSYILGNPFISPLNVRTIKAMFSGFYFSSWTPLALLSHAIDYALWGLDPRGHHLTNLVVHAVNTVWVFLIGLQIMAYARAQGNPLAPSDPRRGMPEPEMPDIGAALIAALFFSWHPLRVESVACASSRKELLCAFFAFPAAYAYLSYRLREGTPDSKYYWGALALFTLAMLAKPAAMTWPLVMLGFELIEARRQTVEIAWKRILARCAPFFAVAAVVAVVAYAASRTPGTVNLLGEPPSLLLPPYTFWFYLQKTFLPLGMSSVYEVPGGLSLAISSAAGILAVLFVLWIARRGFPALLVGLSVFLVTLLPVLGVVPTSIQAISNRYTYVASPAWGICLGYIFFRWWRWDRGRLQRILLVGGTVAVLGALALLARREIRTWQSAETMWRNAATISPTHPVVRLDLGLTLLDEGEYAESIQQILAAIDLKPDYAEAYSALGGAYAVSGDTLHAEQAYEKSLQILPGNYLALSRFGNLRIAQKRFREATVLLNAALAQAPGDAFTRLCIADLCYRTGDAEHALQYALSAIAIRPTYGEAYYVAAAILLGKSPQNPEGIAYLRRAAALGFRPAISQIESRRE